MICILFVLYLYVVRHRYVSIFVILLFFFTSCARPRHTPRWAGRQCQLFIKKRKKSRIRETTNLSTDADRHTDTERNIKKKSSPLDLVRWGGGGVRGLWGVGRGGGGACRKGEGRAGGACMAEERRPGAFRATCGAAAQRAGGPCRACDGAGRELVSDVTFDSCHRGCGGAKRGAGRGIGIQRRPR